MIGGDGAVDDEDFVHRQRPPPSRRFLSSNCATTPRSERGEHRAHLRLLIGRENVDHAIHRLARVIRVQRAEDEQAGLGGGEGELDRFQVAHFADQHDVGILAQRGFQAQRGRIGACSGTSRWVMMLFLFLCTNSIGSSMVMMCR